MNPDLEQQALTAAIRSRRASQQREADEHLSNDRLLEYHDGALTDDEAERLREHLALCPDCAQRGLDLASFVRPELADEVDLPAQAAVLDWGRTRQALAQEGFFDDSRGASAKPVGRGLFAFSAPRLAYAMAAVFVLLSAALSWRLVAVHRNLAELTGPRANVRIVDLYPRDAGSQRDASLPPAATAAATAEPLVLVLHLLDPGSYPGYRVEVVELGPSAGAAIWSSDHLERSPEGDFTVLVSRRLPADEYRVRLFGVDDEQPDLLAEYALKFAAP